jgi:2'-5' RNA ligase
MVKRDKRHQKVRPPDPNSMEATWRLFIAVPMPEPVRALAGDLIARMAVDELPIRWGDPESVHLTLHFLGETSPERAELLRLALATPLAQHGPFQLVTTDLGVFPNPRQPRVIWLGLAGDLPRLERLARDTGQTLQRLGFPIELGRFRPHLTLGRVRENPPPTLSNDVEWSLGRVGASLPPIDISVEEVLLVRSFLGKGKPRHEPIARYKLTGERGH